MSLKNKKKILIFSAIFLTLIFTFSVVQTNQNEKENTSQVNAKIAVNTSKIEWGIKRGKNHEQPDLGTVNKQIMDELGGICLGNKDKPFVYLTFDMGYEGGYTEKIFDVLKQNNVKATFFITGHYLTTASDLVKRMIDEGHIVEKFGYEMKYIRPPKGEYSEASIEYTNKLGYKTVMWSFAYDDWDNNKQGREEYGKAKIMDNIHNGAVLLLHGTSKDNANILDYCIKEIKNSGYEFKSLDEFEI